MHEEEVQKILNRYKHKDLLSIHSQYFQEVAEEICQLFGPKHETILECCGKPESECRCDEDDFTHYYNAYTKLKIEFQRYKDSMADVLDAKDKECQQRVERIFKEIDEHRREGTFDSAEASYDRNITVFKERGWYKSLKKQNLGK